MKFKNNLKKIVCLGLAGSMCTAGLAVSAQEYKASSYIWYDISNPYETVDWDTYGQYKADFHAHTKNSDGSDEPADMIKEHYYKDFDILSITDHNHTTWPWNNKEDTSRVYLTDEEFAKITQTMTPIIGNEQSRTDHINGFFVDWNNASGATMESTLRTIEELGGISHINHPGRYTGNDPSKYEKYVDLFMAFDSCVGMEIINKKDVQPNDRILWDNILTETMPERPVWGFSNDDTHSLANTGFSYNMMLMPENTEEEIRYSMENGTFYATALVASELGKQYDASVPAPTISEIVAEDNMISIKGDDFYKVEWISEGEVVATGSTIELGNYDLNGYVRANLYGEGGMSYTQPFGLVQVGTSTVPKISLDRTVEIGKWSTGTIYIDEATADVVDIAVEYDPNMISMIDLVPADGVTKLSEKQEKGKVRTIVMIEEGTTELFTINAKAGNSDGRTTVGVVRFDAAFEGETVETILTSSSNAVIEIRDMEKPIQEASVELLSEMMKYFMYDTAHPEWHEVSMHDLNGDGVIDINDFVIMAKAIIETE